MYNEVFNLTIILVAAIGIYFGINTTITYVLSFPLRPMHIYIIAFYNTTIIFPPREKL